MMMLLLLLRRIGLIAVRVVLFIMLLMIALTNTGEVEFYWFVNQSFKIPLNLLLFGAFLSGLLLCGIALLFSKRRK